MLWHLMKAATDAAASTIETRIDRRPFTRRLTLKHDIDKIKQIVTYLEHGYGL